MKTLQTSLLLPLLCLSISCSAQLGWGVKAGVGLSQISGYYNFQNVKLQVYPSPSFAVGPYGEWNLGKHFSLESELLFSLITDHFRTVQLLTTTNPVPLQGLYFVNYYRQIGFLSVPVLLGVKVKSFQFYGGFQGSTYLFGHYQEHANNAAPMPSFDYKGELQWIDQFDYGPKVAATWNFRDRWSAEASFYQGLPDLLPTNVPSLSWHTRQLLIGLRYRMR